MASSLQKKAGVVKWKVGVKYSYKFQFNNDIASCLALMAIIKDGWDLVVQEDGYTWLIYTKWKNPNM